MGVKKKAHYGAWVAGFLSALTWGNPHFVFERHIFTFSQNTLLAHSLLFTFTLITMIPVHRINEAIINMGTITNFLR